MVSFLFHSGTLLSSTRRTDQVLTNSEELMYWWSDAV